MQDEALAATQLQQGVTAAEQSAATAADKAYADDLLVLAGKANSVTHNREWKQFVRALSAPEKIPVDLRPVCTNSRVSAFNIWLEAGRDLDKMSVVFKRKMIQKSLVKQERGGQMLEIQNTYGKEKAGTLAERLENQDCGIMIRTSLRIPSSNTIFCTPEYECKGKVTC